MTTFDVCRLPPSKRMKPPVPQEAPARRPERNYGPRAASPSGVRWGNNAHLVVTFLDDPGTAMKTTILDHMNAWRADPNMQVSFAEGAGGHIRIACVAGEGNWSEVGNQADDVSAGAATMNLDLAGIGSSTVIRRIVMHEAGHCLGLVHEHLREPLVDLIDPALAIAYFANLNGWSEAETRRQVLTPLPEAGLVHDGAPDPYSIMTYFIPASITTNGEAIYGSSLPSARDYAFIRNLYPGDP